MKHKHFNRLLSMLLVVATLFGLMAVPASAASLGDSGTVTIQQAGYGNYLSKKNGGTIGGGYWKYTSNNGVTGTAYCVNHGLKGVSPSKALTVQEYNREPKTMGAFANGYPNRTLEQFKELHANDVRGIASLTEDEYKYATQMAVWATCGQLSVPGTSFTAGRDVLTEPTSDAQKIRVFDSIKAILRLANGWTQHLHTGLSLRAEENRDVRGVEVVNEFGLEGAAEDGTDGIKLERINGREYYTRVVYVSSATSTWIDDYKTKVYSTDAPQGTIFVAENNSPLETVQENGATCYKVDTSKNRTTTLNSNGGEYYGAFKVCIPVDTAAAEGSFTIKAAGGVAQFNLYLAYNPSASEQSYIISDPGYTNLDAQIPFKWSGTEEPDTASLQVIKAGAGGAPLEGAEFTLTGDRGTSVSGATDRNGQIVWRDLPADEKFTLTETAAPEGYQIVAPMNVTLTPGRTEYVTITDDVERGFTIKKVDAQNKGSLQGAVFRFEQINGSYMTTGITGFDGTISFEGDELPYGSYRITEQTPPDGYVKSDRVETVEWDGTKDVLITWENVRDISLTIIKVDEQTGVSLPNASFDVFADGKLITSVTTNDDGEARVTGIQKEAYIEIVETAAPAGYVLDKTPHGIHIDPYDPATEDDPVLTVTNRARPALRILKYDLKSNSPMPDVTFEVWHDGDLFGEYTTNASGEIFLYDLEPGTYLVKEVATDDAHVVNSTPQQIELKAGETQTRELVFFNSLKPGIHLIKVDSITMKSLPNVRFEFKLVGGSYRQEFTTDINGEIDLSKLTPGAYEVRELEAPDGYLIDDAVRVVQVNPDENANFVFTNTPKPSLRLIKTSSDGTRLGGVHFRIARIEDGTHYLDRITDDNGEINISKLEPGVYSVKETATVADHILDLQEYHVELFPGQTSTITIENQRRPNLIVYKKDADTGDPIPNTVFLVKAADGHSVDEIKTDSEGKATLDNLLPGVYEVSEKSVPAPWLMDAPSQLVTLYPNRDHTIYFENHKKPTLTVNKVDSITGSPIKGAKFEVWYGSNNTTTGELNSLGTFFSDENGQFFVDLLRDGWYKVTELEPAAGYTIKQPATQEFYIKGGESKVITFENVPKNAVIVEKYDSVTGAALPGCTFQLRYLGGTSGTGGTVIGTKVTGKNGTAMWTGLNPGAYVLEEVDAADGYNIIQSSETIMLADSGEQSVVTVRFSNAPDGILLIRKVCSVNPSVTLQNAEFKVLYADGTVVGDSNGVFRTDENGEIRITGLTPGKSVVVTETRAPAGFILDTQSQTVQIKEGRTVSLTFKNQPRGAIIIQKRDSATDQPLPGAEFRVTTAAGCEVGLDGVIGTSTLTQNGIFTTDAQGEIKITNLAPGAYVLTEIKAPTGYVMDTASTNVVIGQGGDTQTVIVKNSKAGTLVIDKRDSLTGKPLQGVTFKVTTSTGEFVPAENGQISSNGLYFTDKDGKITINGVVGTLVVTETATIPGYTIDEATRTQTVVVNPNDTQTLHFTNTPSTTLVIEKYIEGTTTPLKGVTFLVTDSSGAVVGNSNGEFITDENGRIVLNDLTPGTTVTAREVKALEGYVLDGQPKSILIKAGEVQTLRFYNAKQGTIVVKKLDKQTNEPLAGVEFQITYADGSYLDDDYGHLSSKGLYKTDANGEIRISGVVGTLVITETKPLPGYVMDEGTKTQTVKVNPTDTQTITVYNTKVGGLTIIKKDEETGERISGVQFEIRKLNGEIVGTYTTDRSGVISLPEAEKGWYQVTELKAAKGYQLDSQPYQIEVKDGGTATLEITNRQTGSAIIHKIDSVTGKGIFGVKFLLSDAKGNPVGTYESDNEGYVYVDGGLADGKYTIREIECAEGYILDTQPKTIYVEYGGCTTITWKNTAITGQLQITKTSADYNSMNGWPAGTPIPGTVFEVYHYRTGNLVDTIRTDKNGVAVSKPLPLGRYKVVESKAADFYALDKTPIDVEIEHAGQIVKAAMTNKSLYTNVAIEKSGYKEVMPGQNIRYTFSNIANNSTTALTSFYWRDTLPVEAVRLAKITTGTYNAAGSYKIVYKTNLSGADYRVLADSLNTQQNYVLEASPVALRLASNEYVTEVMFVFGVVPANFRQVEAPKIDCTVVSWAKGGSQFVNQADVGGVYNGQWIMATTRWVTKVYAPSKPLPRTGY
ncbi:SpaA isopeptide-forming pilin-related protein [Anaerotruncus colihominis]|uniref:SpaA isopeptide-forming pilin-related protein n=1 Tax=Anaerotruncus colihominis TaxID=169435 RepID=UPI00138F2958|nr:SpaA isopeptide-forming pilin-related protein [Anaerotruncus colihominis]MCR2027026.1 SpaA isopeptide-forming pilin-related protein [Anaerotruncus colihominis]